MNCDYGSPLEAQHSWKTINLDQQGVVRATSLDLPGLEVGTLFADLLAPAGKEAFVAWRAHGDDEGAGLSLPLANGYGLDVVIVPLASGYRLFCRAIGRQRQAWERLSFFYRFFVTSRTSICITDPDGSIIEANPHFLDFYGYTLDEVRGQNPRILKSGRQSPDAYQQMWQRISDPATGHWSGEIINRRKNAEEVTVHLSISAVRNREQALVGYIASAMDISAHKQLERELQASNEELLELNSLKSELMAITSHDLKSPLNAIISRARLLMETDGSLTSEKRLDALEKIVEAGEKLTRFIGDLLDLEKIENGRYQLVSERLHLDAVLKLCVETNRPTADEKGVALDLRFVGSPRPIRADLIKLEQIFNNILSNAVRYTPAGGKISMVCTALPGKPQLVTITDTGPGIPEKDLPFVFDRYYQAKIKGGIAARVFGAGLGLSIVKKLVELHDGKVWVANNAGGGCVFSVELPTNRRAISGQDLAAVIIDPLQRISSAIEGPLRRKGCSCFMVRTLREAQRLIEREHPELIFAAWSDLPAPLAAFLATVQGLVRTVAVGEAGPDELPACYGQSLLLPVADIELYELLDAVMFELNHQESP